MTIKIPKNYMGKPIEGSLERVLASAPAIPDATTIAQPIVVPTPANINDPQNYIILPGKTHGNYSYPDLLVAMERTHRGKNWEDSHRALSQENSFMLNIRQFADFLNLIRSKKAYDGNGILIDERKIDSILDLILTVRDPWRSEWLDAKFESKGGLMGVGKKMHIQYGYGINSNGQLCFTSEFPLDDYLSSNKTPGIDTNDWLSNANKFGLPKSDVKDGNLYYWRPTDGSVAWFGANSVGAVLSCGRYASDAGSSLGVRAARPKK